MTLTVNGTLIPQDKANAITVNGANITNVWANGVQVWAQQLFAAQWSGSSNADAIGINTSGSLFRARHNSIYGAYLTAFSNGTFTNGASVAGYLIIHGGGNSGTLPNQIRTTSGGMGLQGIVSFNIDVGFTGGGSLGGGSWYFQTSGGLLSILYSTAPIRGAWISLT